MSEKKSGTSHKPKGGSVVGKPTKTVKQSSNLPTFQNPPPPPPKKTK